MLGCCFGMIPANAEASSSVSRGLSKLDLESVSAADRAIIMDASTYAYMSIENASDSVTTKILKARSDIIFHQSWSLDGQAKIVRADGTVEDLPDFYDLFLLLGVFRAEKEMLQGLLLLIRTDQYFVILLQFQKIPELLIHSASRGILQRIYMALFNQ